MLAPAVVTGGAEVVVGAALETAVLDGVTVKTFVCVTWFRDQLLVKLGKKIETTYLGGGELRDRSGNTGDLTGRDSDINLLGERRGIHLSDCESLGDDDGLGSGVCLSNFDGRTLNQMY